MAVSASAIAAITASRDSAGSFSQQYLDPGEEPLNRIDIGTAGGKVTQFGAGGFDEVCDAGHFVAGETVEDDDIALT